MTIKELLARAVERTPDAVALRFKRNGTWEETTYAQLLERVRWTAALLDRLGVKPGEHIALFCENAPEWIEIYLAATGTGCAVVPLDPKLREQEAVHILADSNARVLFAMARSYPLVRDAQDHLPHLERVVLLQGPSSMPEDKKPVRYHDYNREMAELQEAGDNAAASCYDAVSPDDESVASIIYTSGTTGRPKGAMLSHGNFTANVESCLQAFQGLREDDNFLLVLPLHHAFAFTACLLVPLAVPCAISLVESLKTVGENIVETKPSVLIGVPLLLEKMYAKIQAGIQKKLTARLMLAVGLGRVVGRKIIAKLGGRLRIVVSGGAPCAPELIEGWARLGLIVREGYGLTETAPVLALNPAEKNKPGTVGKALPGIDLKILEPNREGVGEVAARGRNVMLGYYNNPAATGEVIQDGWFLTGDLGFFDEEGYLTISGRKKNLIVNREGKNIYPEEVEAQVLKSPYILEALVLGYRDPGDKVGERVGIIVVPDQEAVLAARPGLSDQELEVFIQREVRTQCSHLSEYKRPRCIQIHYEEFEKTSTQKVKRYPYAINTSQL